VRQTDRLGPSVDGNHPWAGGRLMSDMKRRECLVLLGRTGAAGPLAGLAQQRPAGRREVP
jgi:hypothetical protein